MGTFPTRRDEFLNWCTAHDPVWVANAATIGVTPTQASDFHKAVTDMQNAVIEAETARQASKAATMSVNDMEAALRTLATEMVQRIRTFAQSTNNPNVYVIAQVPPIQPATPMGPPGTPTDFKVSLTPQGAIVVKFKCQNPAGAVGTSYLVKRRLGGQVGGVFAYLTLVGKKTFTDDTFPGGSTVEYTVQAQRGNVSGETSSTLVVRFGAGGDGLSFSVVPNDEDKGVKLAA